MPGVPHYRLLSTGGRRRLVSRRVLIDPGRSRPFDAGEWSGAIVVVERGILELQWKDGACLTFRPGDLLCLAALGLASLRATGAAPTLLVVVRRV